MIYPQKCFEIEDDDPLKLCPLKCLDDLPQSATGVEQGELDIEVQVDRDSGVG